MPHEVDMTRALILSLREWWREQPQPMPVQRVVLQVGKFTCVEPSLLLSAFAQQRQHTPFLRNAVLEVRDIPFIAHCQHCCADYAPDIGLEYGCPSCCAGLHDIRSGRELKIERVEWELPETETNADVWSKQPA